MLKTPRIPALYMIQNPQENVHVIHCVTFMKLFRDSFKFIQGSFSCGTECFVIEAV